MKLVWVRALLLVLAAMTARDCLAFDCRRRLLTDDEHRSLEAVVLKVTGIAADPTSIRACRNWWVVEAETLRAPQSDGTERWSRVTCTKTRKSSPEPWICVDYPLRGFRADTYPGELGVWVALGVPTKLSKARRDVALGFRLMAAEAAIPYCGNANDAAPKPLAALRAQITGGSGIIEFVWTGDEFSLGGGDVEVHFERTSESTGRVKCWLTPEITVTG